VLQVVVDLQKHRVGGDLCFGDAWWGCDRACDSRTHRQISASLREVFSAFALLRIWEITAMSRKPSLLQWPPRHFL
jgi:hypothetical protein